MPARLDGLSNCLTGIGDPDVDTRLATRRTWAFQRSVYELEQEWLQSWMAYVEVSTLPEAMFRAGFDVINIKPDTIDSASIRSWVEGDLTVMPDGSVSRQRGLGYHAWQLREQGDKFGGALLYPILDDGLDPREPLDVRRIERVVGWEVFDRGEITPWGSSRNLEPQYYVLSDVVSLLESGEHTLQPGDIIHASRVIVHKGRDGVSRREQRYRQWWGVSVLELNEPARRAAEYGAECARTYMDRVSWLHLSMAELNELLQTTDDAGNEIGEDIVSTRLRTIRKFARTLGIVATDGGRAGSAASEVNQPIPPRNPDKLESVGESSGDLAKLVELNWTEWAYGSRLPASIAFGQAPTGLRGGDNVGDWQKFEGDVKFAQRNWGTRVINKMLLIEFAAKQGPTGGVIPDEWEIHWRPLRISTPSELAEIDRKRAEADEVRIRSSVIAPDEVREQRLVKGDVDGPLRVEPTVTEEEAVAPEPALVGIASAVLEAAIAVGEGTITPEFFASYLTSIDEARYPEVRATEIAQSARSFSDDLGVAEAEVSTDDAPEMVEPFSTDPRPSDLMKPRDIAAKLSERFGMPLHTATVTALARRNGLRRWSLAGKSGFSLADIERVLASEVEPQRADSSGASVGRLAVVGGRVCRVG